MENEIDYFAADTVILAHRGDSINRPENTVFAFRGAVEAGADVIELDLHLTSDKRCVVIHDSSVSHLGGRSVPISELSFLELSSIDAGYAFSTDDGRTYPYRGKGLSIPLFEEVLESFSGMRFNVDLKDESRELADIFKSIVYKYHAQSRVLVASFSFRNLKYIRRIAPDIQSALGGREILKLYINNKIGINIFRTKFKGCVLQIPEVYGKIRLITPGFIEYVKSRGYRIQVWTVNDPEDMERLLKLGVDGLFTDNPLLLYKKIRNE